MKHMVRHITKEELQRVESVYLQNRASLESYADLLLWWNKKINLVSRGVSRETILQHIKHSLFVCLVEGFADVDSLFDTGSGGGLPGVPLALCFEDKRFRINDIVIKKVFAVNDMISKLELTDRVSGDAGDVSGALVEKNSFVITKHAFRLDQLYSLIHTKPWEKIVFLKGFEEALEEAEKIEDKVSLDVIRLDTGYMDSFYKGKAVVSLKRECDE